MLHIVVSLLLGASGVTAIVADRQRWLPACAGGLDTPECVTVQSDWYDVTPPGESWIPIGSTAPLMATSLALMALAVPALFRVALPSRWAWPLGAVCAVPFGVVAASIFASAAAGHAVALPGTTASSDLLAYLWPLVLVALLVAGVLASEADRSFLLAATGLLVLASPLVLYLAASLVYLSHDTPPWMHTIGGLATILAAGALLVPDRPFREVRRPAPELLRAGTL